MHAFRKLFLAAAIVGVSACGSDNPAAPDLDMELDPAVIEARLADVESIHDHPALATLLELGSGSPAVTSVSKTFERTSKILSRTKQATRSGTLVRNPHESRRISAAVGQYVPVENRGTVYLWEGEAGWIESQRSGAPSDGIRFIIPELDASGLPTSNELGWLDVRDLGTETSDRVVASLVAGGKTLFSMDERESETETSWSESGTAVVTDGVHRVEYTYTYNETGTSEADYRGVEQYTLGTNVGLAYRGSWVWGDMRASDVNYDEVTVGRATIRFAWRSVFDAESQRYYESDDADITVNGQLVAREIYDETLGDWVYEDAEGEPLSEERIAQLNTGFMVTEWLWEAVMWPAEVVWSWTYSVAGAPIL